MNDNKALLEGFSDLLESLSSQPFTSTTSGENGSNAWQKIVDSGFLGIMANENAGGAGLAIPDMQAFWVESGANAPEIPLGLSILISGLIEKKLTSETKNLPISIALRSMDSDENTLRCRSAAFGSSAEYFVVIDPLDPTWSPRLLPKNDADQEDLSLPSSSHRNLTWSNPHSFGEKIDLSYPWLEAAALVTACTMTGSLNRILEITLEYSKQRSQFGKQISKFQAIQQQLSVMAEEISAANAITQYACMESLEVPHPLFSGVAKARTSQAAEKSLKIAHAVHGAIGITEEYSLQRFTRALIDWKTDFGSESFWHKRIGKYLLEGQTKNFSEFIATNL